MNKIERENSYQLSRMQIGNRARQLLGKSIIPMWSSNTTRHSGLINADFDSGLWEPSCLHLGIYLIYQLTQYSQTCFGNLILYHMMEKRMNLNRVNRDHRIILLCRLIMQSRVKSLNGAP